MTVVIIIVTVIILEMTIIIIVIVIITITIIVRIITQNLYAHTVYTNARRSDLINIILSYPPDSK